MTNIYINGDNNVVNVVTGGQPVRVAATRRKIASANAATEIN